MRGISSGGRRNRGGRVRGIDGTIKPSRGEASRNFFGIVGGTMDRKTRVFEPIPQLIAGDDFLDEFEYQRH
jgi:hypothetical protein